MVMKIELHVPKEFNKRIRIKICCSHHYLDLHQNQARMIKVSLYSSPPQKVEVHTVKQTRGVIKDYLPHLLNKKTNPIFFY